MFQCNLPVFRFFTVHTAFGVPGKSETAISLTSKPCLSTRIVLLGPRPQATYNCGVSSWAKSAMWHRRKVTIFLKKYSNPGGFQDHNFIQIF